MCPRTDMDAYISDTPVTMCACDNLWLKALDGQRGSVDIADDTCGNDGTTEELVQQWCQRSDTGSVSHFVPSFLSTELMTHAGMLPLQISSCKRTANDQTQVVYHTLYLYSYTLSWWHIREWYHYRSAPARELPTTRHRYTLCTFILIHWAVKVNV